jgi:pilus assembly protein Flp/PilA
MLKGSGVGPSCSTPELVSGRRAPAAVSPPAERDERGASATEYGLLAVAIAAIIVIIVFALGGVVNEMFSNSCSSIQNSAGTDAACG